MRQEDRAAAEARMRQFGAILTAKDRAAWLTTLQNWDETSQAHIDRLRLIYAPFPAVRRLESTYPWAGTITVDTIFGTGIDRHRKLRKRMIDDEND